MVISKGVETLHRNHNIKQMNEKPYTIYICRVEAKVKTYTVQGTPQNGHVPVMVLSHTREAYDNNSLFGVWFETNPLEGACDTRVELKTRHIDFIYDAVRSLKFLPFKINY